jgi:hypothetical protein
MGSSRARFVLAALCLVAWPLPAFGGVLIVEKTTYGADAPQTHQVQIDKSWMRMEQSVGGEKQAFIFDGTKEVVWIVSLDRKTYSEMTKADVDRMGVQMSDAMAKMQEQMKKLPPDQRAMVEQMMKSRGMGPAVTRKTTYRKVGTDKVGRWACDKYEGYQDTQKIAELCTVDPSVLGFVPADFEVSRKLAEFFKKLVPQNSDNLFAIGTPDEQGFSGVPIKRVFTVAGRPTTTEMTEVTRQNFPPSTFEVPAGFTKKPFGEK